jgi:hypothetical protein
LPLLPGCRNLALLVEGLNTALLSNRACFATLASVYIVQQRDGELRTGLLPTTGSCLDDVIDALTRLRSWGFKANCWTLEGPERHGFVSIESERIDVYRGYRKTRVDALRRVLDL